MRKYSSALTQSKSVGLRPSKEDENRISALRNAIQEGLDSGIETDFKPDKHLKSLKAKRQSD